MWPADGNAGFFLGFFWARLTSGIVWKTTAESSLLASGSMKSTVPHAVFSTRLTFIILRGKRNGGRVRRGSRTHTSMGSSLVVSLRVQIYCGFLGHLLAVDELL